MIDHVSIAARDLARSFAFYERALAPLGDAKLVVRERAIGFGKSHSELWLNLRENLPAVSLASGAHVAFRARNPQAFNAFHAAALAGGGTDTGRGSWLGQGLFRSTDGGLTWLDPVGAPNAALLDVAFSPAWH